jgi:acylphosphatase
MAGFQAIVSGRVQGVGFRWFVQRAAERLGVRGTVRNLPDGAVEVNAEANPAALDALIAELKTGPGMSRVDSVDLVWRKTNQGYRDFRITR